MARTKRTNRTERIGRSLITIGPVPTPLADRSAKSCERDGGRWPNTSVTEGASGGRARVAGRAADRGAKSPKTHHLQQQRGNIPMSIMHKRGWIVATAFALSACLLGGYHAQGQVNCDCNAGQSQGYSLDNYGASPCGNGCGTGGSFLGRLRSAFNCDPKFRPGLWDGYCEERNQCGNGLHGHHGGLGLRGGLGLQGAFAGGAACDKGCSEVAPASDCNVGAGTGCGLGCGWFGRHRACSSCGLLQHAGRRHSLRFFSFPQAAGCGSGAFGLPCEADCGQAVATTEPVATANDCGAAAGCAGGCEGGAGCGCGSIFGIKMGCFRNDGHFFGCLSRHGHRHASACDSGCDAQAGGCRLFSGHGLRRHGGFGLFGRGHCQNGCDTPVLAADCGSDSISTVVPQPTPATDLAPAVAH